MATSILELEGARVLFKTRNDPTQNLGRAGRARITALAICEYPDAPGQIYVFACDRQWKVVGDLLYSSVDEAKAGAEQHYEVSASAWFEAT